jgi:hypothetical protein
MNKRIFIFLIPFVIVLCLYSCNQVLNDQASVFQEKVTDKLTGNAVDSVIVGMIIPSALDSVVFLSDSVNRAFIRFDTKTDSTGKYCKYFGLGSNIDPVYYKDIFAFKKGYKLWRYLEHNSKVKRSDLIDELNFEMEKN